MEKSDRDPQALLTAARSGDERALHSLLGQFHDRLRVHARLMCGPVVRAYESASDLVDSVCREVLLAEDRLEYRGEREFFALLCRMVEHKIHDRVKFLQRDKRDVARELSIEAGSEAGGMPLSALYGTVLTPSDYAIANETLERLEQAVDRLKERERLAFVRMRVDGCSFAQLAQELELSESGARTLTSRAHLSLAELMAIDP